MGLGGAEMDKSLAEDIRAELEENRQYLVRALRAVETTTAECKEETREATLKAENALAQVRSLEDAVAKKDAQIAGIREAGEERIRALREQLQGQVDQLEEQREQTEGLQQALEAQSLTLVDLREQVYVLQLRVLKSDEEADRATTVLNRAAEDKVAALVARVDKCEGELDNVQRKQQTFDSGLEDTLRAAEVKLQAQVSNSEALSALAFEEMETRLKAQMEEVSEAIVEANGSMRDWQEEVSSLDALLQALRQDWEASVQETKSEVEAMFKGEMRLTQRMNAMEGSIKGETSSRMAELEAALAQATYTLQVMTEEFHRKDNEFRAKLDLIAEIIDKQSDAQGRSAESLEEVVQQQRELLSKQQITDQGLVQVKNASNASPETAWQLAEMVRKIEAMENVLQSLESGISAPTMQNELNEQADRLKTVENRLDELQNGPPKETGKREDTSSQEIASQSDIGTLQTRVQTLEKQVEVLSTKPDHAPSRRETAEETQLKEQAASKKASKTTDEKALDDLKSGLKELKQEHMNLYGRVVSMERAKKALDGQARPSSDEPAADFDQWAIEGRVSRIELAMIDILEKQSSVRGDEENLDGMLERLKQAEIASEQVLQGIQSMSDTMSQVLEKQRLLEDRVSAGTEKAGAEAPADSDRLVAEISNMKKEQAAWQKDIERAVKLTTDAFGENSPFVPTQGFEQKTAELMQKISDLQKDLNEGAGFTPRSEHRSVAIEESVRRSAVFDKEGRVNDSQVSVPQILVMPEYEDKIKSLAKVSELQTEVDTKIQGLKDAQEKLKSDADTMKDSLETALKKLEDGKSGLDNELVKNQKELDSRVLLIEGRLKELEAGLLSGVASPISQTKSAERSDIEMEIMQQYQTAIGHANDRIKDNQAAIDELKSAQLKWNGKLEQTLEVANEAFGQNTPFVMKEQVEHLEADHQNLLTELQTLRDSVAQLESSVTAAAATSDNAAEAREKDAARSSMQDQIASLTKAMEQQQESLKTKIAQLESSVTAAAATSDNATAGAARSAETPGGDKIDKGSPEAAKVELEALNAAMEKEKKAREALETKVDKLVHTACAQGEAEASEKDAARSSMQDQIASLTKAMEQQQESLKAKIAQLESSVTAAATFVMKEQVEHLEADHQNLLTELQTLRDSVAQLESSVTAAAATSDNAAEAREKDAARSSMQDQIASLTKAMEQQQESLKTKIAQLESSVTAAAATSDNATAGAARSAETPGGDKIDKGSPEAAKVELEALNAAMEKEKKAREALETKVDQKINEGIEALNATIEKEKKERETLHERFTALEPMRDEFVAEKMHTDSELNILKQQYQELAASQQKELESTTKWREMLESKSGNGAAESQAVHSDLKDLKDTLMQTINSRDEMLGKKIKEGLEAHRGDAAAEAASKSEMAKRIDSLIADVKFLKDGVASQQTAQRSIEDAMQAAIARNKTLQESTQKQENDVKKHEEEINAMKKAMKKSDEEHTEDAQARSAAKQAAKEAETKVREELETLKEQVSKLINSRSIEGDLHKGLSDVEQLVSENEAGVKSLNKAVLALEKQLDTLEKANKQAGETAVSRLASQIGELDEAMEVRENENAALDGRVEKLEQHAAEVAERVAGVQARMEDLAHQCKLLNDQTQQLDDYVARNSVTKDEFLKVQSALDNTASKSDLARVTDKVVELEDQGRQRDVGGEGSVTARSLHSERDGSFSGFHDELAVASEGSARIRALAARVRGVTQSGTSVNASPIGAPREGAANTVFSPTQITSPRSMLEETAERIREWEVRNQKQGSDDDHGLQFV